ncbi:glutaredoxin-like protein [Plasmodium ovale wallikeri]|uniref:Glutaredoxin-like protein n=2 Tax=Plasmodium ovale TaxID=36330 RepID=A0A1A8YH07_PLAOA|nr:glutaredoxin-like protein [Plasmodium ovale wallikeri]SBT30835.1 glutaredoxin-like protein [Plasmodium ovale wallikeri]SBT75159.1 glutaredoxin-like protein, putative [Plasmodium ovale]
MYECKKMLHTVYFCGAFGLYAAYTNAYSENNLFEVNKFTKLQKEKFSFCEGRSARRDINTGIHGKTLMTSEVHTDGGKHNNTSNEVLKGESITKNGSILRGEQEEDVKYNYRTKDTTDDEGNNCNSVNEKGTEFINRTNSTEAHNAAVDMGSENGSNMHHIKQIQNSKMCSDGLEEEKETTVELTEEIVYLIENILKKHKLVLFMKGTALNPFCKYSRQAIHILKLNKVKEIHTVNILDNEQLRSSLKIYSDWPTFPQLYVQGKFIGGIDKVQELHDNNKLKKLLEEL